ncbi:MAG: ATP-dependent zinc metalloprotease FtsH [Rikenellaceae bacterium]
MANKSNNKNKGLMGGKVPGFNIFWVYGIIAAMIVGFSIMGDNEEPQKSNWEQVQELMSQGAIDKIEVINNERAEVYVDADKLEGLKSQEAYKNLPDVGPQFEFNVGALEYFQDSFYKTKQEQTQASDVELSFEKREDMWGNLFSSIFPFVLIIAVWIFVMRSMSRGQGGGQSGIFNVGKSKAQVYDKDKAIRVTFKDVAGLEEAKVEVMEVVDFLKNPKKYSDLGGKVPKGALLVGPPGTGKTLLAKAVAGEAHVPFFSISGSDFVEMFVGVGASRVRDLFRQAKEKSPCIVFIDEIDAIGRARSKNAGYSSNDERENTLNQLLTEMDGFGTNSGVIILAATNRVDILDKALLRAGRFDRQIDVGLPDIAERREIFEVHLRGIKMDKNMERDFLSRQTPGFSGADIANVCNEAALMAARKNKKLVDKDDFLGAIDRIVGGLEKRNTIITPDEKRAIAYHEAGHASISWVLEHANPLIKVTIIPRGKALGAAWYVPDERQLTGYDQLIHEMASILGGRASEEIMLGKIYTGALNDLERVTKQAYAMVAYYGMSSKIGNRSYYDSSGRDEMSFKKPFSERTAQEIDDEVKRIIDEAFDLARKTIMEHKQGLTALAELLLEKEVVFAEDLERIFGKRKGDQVRELREKLAEQAKEAIKADNYNVAVDNTDDVVAENGESAGSDQTAPTEQETAETSVEQKQPEA